MRLLKKSLSRVTLLDLLRRKKTNLEKFLSDNGIVTHELLVSRCNSMGVVAPTEKEFNDARGNPVIHEVSSPTEGIVVLEPPPLISDYSGKTIVEVTAEDLSDSSSETLQKKSEPTQDTVASKPAVGNNKKKKNSKV